MRKRVKDRERNKVCESEEVVRKKEYRNHRLTVRFKAERWN